MQPEFLLNQLRDIHLPDAISYWPFAPGWYILFFLIFIATPYLIWFLIKKRKLDLYKKTIFLALEKLGKEKNISQIATLLKRIAINRHGNKVACLQGREWIAFLEKTKQKKSASFESELGELLIKASYQKNVSETDQQKLPALMGLITQWVKKNV
jgi:hypothetical protein